MSYRRILNIKKGKKTGDDNFTYTWYFDIIQLFFLSRAGYDQKFLSPHALNLGQFIRVLNDVVILTRSKDYTVYASKRKGYINTISISEKNVLRISIHLQWFLVAITRGFFYIRQLVNTPKKLEMGSCKGGAGDVFKFVFWPQAVKGELSD